MLAVVQAAYVFGAEWWGKEVVFHCDNTGVVAAINGGPIPLTVSPLLEHLPGLSRHYGFSYRGEYIPWKENTVCGGESANVTLFKVGNGNYYLMIRTSVTYIML